MSIYYLVFPMQQKRNCTHQTAWSESHHYSSAHHLTTYASGKTKPFLTKLVLTDRNVCSGSQDLHGLMSRLSTRHLLGAMQAQKALHPCRVNNGLSTRMPEALLSLLSMQRGKDVVTNSNSADLFHITCTKPASPAPLAHDCGDRSLAPFQHLLLYR